MGLAASWICVRPGEIGSVIAALGLEDTGAVQDQQFFERGAYSLAKTPKGWDVLFAEGHDLWLEPPSHPGEMIVAQVEEHVMVSGARLLRDGVEIWSVAHDPEIDPHHLEATGDLPKAFASLKKKALAEAEEDDEADLIFDVPNDLVEAVTGFSCNRDPRQGRMEWRLLVDPTWRPAPPRGGLIGQILGALFGRKTRA